MRDDEIKVFQYLGEYDTRQDRLRDLVNGIIGGKDINTCIYSFNNTGDHSPLTSTEIAYVKSITNVDLTDYIK